jgi:hypothetical protein
MSTSEDVLYPAASAGLIMYGLCIPVKVSSTLQPRAGLFMCGLCVPVKVSSTLQPLLVCSCVVYVCL